MTNTRLTDPEILETRYPVRLREWSVRRGSGGAGKHRGGDGMVREFEFLAALDVSLLTSRRATRPRTARTAANPASRAATGSGARVRSPSPTCRPPGKSASPPATCCASRLPAAGGGAKS